MKEDVLTYIYHITPLVNIEVVFAHNDSVMYFIEVFNSDGTTSTRSLLKGEWLDKIIEVYNLHKTKEKPTF